MTDGDGKLEEKEDKKIFLGLEEEERKQWKEKGKDGGKKTKVNEMEQSIDKIMEKDKKKNVKEILVPFLSAILVFIWFGYHYLNGEYPWMENPELYTGIILLIIASNMVYVFGNTYQVVEERRRKRKRGGSNRRVGEKREEKEKQKEDIQTGEAGKFKMNLEKSPNIVVKDTSIDTNEHKYALLSCQPEKIPNIPVSHFPFVVGRKVTECDVQIMDASIRKKHAGFHRDREDIYLTDYSAGFTSINGHVLEEKECLQIFPGQEIRFSDFSFIWADQKTL